MNLVQREACQVELRRMNDSRRGQELPSADARSAIDDGAGSRGRGDFAAGISDVKHTLFSRSPAGLQELVKGVASATSAIFLYQWVWVLDAAPCSS
jgi:hypothetical protein